MDAWKDITSRLNKNALLQKASLLSGDAPCEFDGPPICRDKWLIFRIRFAANQNSWAARIPKDQEYSFRDISIKPLEVIARRHPRIRAPRLHGYFDAGTAGDNPIGVAYMLVDWIEGKSMQPWTKDHPPTHVRQNFLRQLADITWEMLSDPIDGEDILFYGAPKTTTNARFTATAWLTESVDRALRRNLRQQNLDLVVNYLIQRAMIPRYVVAEVDQDPWVLYHPDLHAANFIIDDDYNVLGVIDWDFSFAQPLQKHAVFPKLLENVPGGAPPELPNALAYQDLAADKAYFVSLVAEKEKQQSGTRLKSTMTTSASKPLLAHIIESSSERNFFELSHHIYPVHQEFVRRYCPRTHENLVAARAQMDHFLAINIGFSDDSQPVTNLIDQLKHLLEAESLFI